MSIERYQHLFTLVIYQAKRLSSSIDLGSALSAIISVRLKVPSAIINLEYNYLLNPAHPDFR